MKTITNNYLSCCRTVFFLASGFFFANTSLAQTITLASWAGQVLAPTAATNVTAESISGPSVSVYNNGTNNPSSFYYGSMGDAANLSYFNLTLTPATGYRLNITNISFRISGMDAPATYAVRSSGDGYTADLATGTATMNMSPYITFDTRTHALSGLSNITDAITLRVYKSSTDDMLHIYNIAVTGTVTSILLPLRFTSFTARKQEGKIRLSLTTENEENTDHLVFERSSNGRTFAAISSLPAGPAPSNTYTVTDFRPLSGNNYYRVKQVDRDNRFSYSNIVAVAADNAVAFNVYPNPVKNTLQLAHALPLQAGRVNLTIETVTGRVVMSKEATLRPDNLPVDVSSLAPGVYFVHLIADGVKHSQRFIKE